MSQPAPGLAPSSPGRPDPEAELLLALGRRDAALCQLLLQHLVHRRGVSVLASLRQRCLALEPDQQGWIWLNQLLSSAPIAAGASAPAPPAACAGPAVRLEPAATPQFQSLALRPIIAAPVVAWTAEAPAATRGRQGSLELELRAEAAVDAAFEALAAEFPAYAPQVVAAPAPQVVAAPAALGPAAAPLAGTELPAEPPQPATGPLQDLQRDASLPGSAPSRCSFVIPQPPWADPLESEQSEARWANQVDQAMDPHRDGSQPPGAVPPLLAGAEPAAARGSSGFWSRAEGRLAGLGERLRSRLSLRRVRTLVRDCVEEAVSSLQGPATAADLQPPGEAWSLEPSPQRRQQSSSALSEHQAPLAAFGPPLNGGAWAATTAAAPAPAPAPTPTRLAATQQLRQTLLGGSQDEGQPAPSPQALADLRAWLPAEDDLPHAS